MESIYILQSTYEKLYALANPVREFLENNLPLISATWKRECVDEVLKTEFADGHEKFVDRELIELDIYYLLKVLLTDKNWKKLKKVNLEDDFYSEHNRSLLFETKEIRNIVAHPRIEKYAEKDYERWNSTLEQTARLFGKELGELIVELHRTEKEKLFNFICKKSFDITMNSPDFEKLPLEKQESIKRTKKRLQDQTTAAGMMALFEDSYFLAKGQPIRKELEEFNLPTFESIMDDVRKFYYGFSQ